MDGKYIYKVPGAAELSPLFLLLLKSDIIHTPEYIPRTWQLGGTRPSRDGTAVHGVAYVCHSARKCEDRLVSMFIPRWSFQLRTERCITVVVVVGLLLLPQLSR